MTAHVIVDVSEELREIRREMRRLAQAVEAATTGEEWVTVEEAARRLKRSKATIYRKVNRGELPVRCAGGIKQVRVWR